MDDAGRAGPSPGSASHWWEPELGLPSWSESHLHAQGHGPRQRLSHRLPEESRGPTRPTLSPGTLAASSPSPEAPSLPCWGSPGCSECPWAWPGVGAQGQLNTSVLAPHPGRAYPSCSAGMQFQGVALHNPSWSRGAARSENGWTGALGFGTKKDKPVLGPGRRCPGRGLMGSLPTPGPLDQHWDTLRGARRGPWGSASLAVSLRGREPAEGTQGATGTMRSS